MSKRTCAVVAGWSIGLLLAGCSAESANVGGPAVEVQVAPLSLPRLVDACYGLEVLNEAGETVWSEAGICADRFGDGASSVTYIGPCDASDPNDDDVSEATVVLRIEGLYAADDSVLPADADALPDVLTDWRNPCAAPYAPNGCRLETTCRENADAPVVFNLTIMREANQGFFDVAVNFDDIFCSAKVDCAYPATETTAARPIELVFDPVTGQRVQTVVWAFACTDGDPGGSVATATHLYMDDLVLRCGTQTYTVKPSEGPGNVYPGGVGAPDPLVQAMVFEGRERILNGGVDADKLYWNVALGLDATYFVAGAPTCVLETKATASKGPLADGETPANTTYPVVEVSVPINSGAAITCTQHPLDGDAPHGGVATDYTKPPADGGAIVPETFGYVGTPSGGGVVTTPVAALVNECALGAGPCDAHAICTDLAVGYTCVCGPGYSGDGLTCVDTNGCAGTPCFAGVACADVPAPGTGFTCGSCPTGYDGDGETCEDIDGCAGDPCYPGVSCSDVPAPGTGYACAACPDGYDGDGETCTDIDECATDSDDCVAPNPLCENTVGGHSCYGTELVAWGQGIANNEPLVGAVAVAAGQSHMLALKGDGTVVAWGDNRNGKASVPDGLDEVVAVDAGITHSVALRADGTVVVWGDGDDGRLDVPAGLDDAVAVAAGNWHTLALRSNGTVVGWGANFAGQTDVPATLTGVVAIAAGDHSVALKSDGTVVAWGLDTWGQATVPGGLTGVVAIGAGYHHTLAVRADGTIVGWGNNPHGQTTVPAGLGAVSSVAGGADHSVVLHADGTVAAWGYNPAGQTRVPPGLRDVVDVDANGWSSIALKKDGTVVAWGLRDYGTTNVPAGLNTPVDIAAGGGHAMALEAAGGLVGWGLDDFGQSAGPVVGIAAGRAHTVALKGDGTVVAWGYNGDGQTNVPGGLSGVVAIAAGTEHTVALEANGTVVAWGNNGSGQTNIPGGLGGVVAIAAGGAHTVALKADGTVVAWGYNFYGQTNVPGGLSGVVAVAAGAHHTVALKADGTVVAWGLDGNGEANVPGGLSGVVAIAAGGYHTLALKADGTVVAWGLNVNGQTNVPGGLSGVVVVAAGAYHTVALEADGTVIAWGYNAHGQTNVPAGLSGVVAIAAGSSHTVALKVDGTVVAWGLNGDGQTTVPAAFAGSGPVEALASGLYHNVALKADGTVLAWGRNAEGQTNVAGLANVTELAAGAYHSLAAKGDGSVVGYGANDYGQLSIPASLTDAVAVAAGGGQSIALKDDGSVIAWGRNDYGQATVPSGLGVVLAVAAGGGFSAALKGDGTVAVWGDPSSGVASVPAALTDASAIAAGGNHLMGLTGDGTVVAWGANDKGQANVPAGLSDVLVIAAGGDQSYAIRRTTYAPRPTIGALSATAGVDGDELTVSGTHFERVVAVRVAGHIARWTVDSPTQLTVILPEVDATGPVEVVTVAGSATSSDDVTVDLVDACGSSPCGDYAQCRDLANAGPGPDGRVCTCWPGAAVTSSGQCAAPGTIAEHPGASCRAIKAFSEDLRDGAYWIDTTPATPGDAASVWCDMTYDDGGWTTIANTLRPNVEDAIPVDAPVPDMSVAEPATRNAAMWRWSGEQWTEFMVECRVSATSPPARWVFPRSLQVDAVRTGLDQLIREGNNAPSAMGTAGTHICPTSNAGSVSCGHNNQSEPTWGDGFQIGNQTPVWSSLLFGATDTQGHFKCSQTDGAAFNSPLRDVGSQAIWTYRIR